MPQRSRALAVAIIWLILPFCPASASSTTPPPLARVSIASGPAGPTIPARFMGLSIDYPALPAYLGPSPQAPNLVFRQILHNLGPGILRVGGDTQDTSCWDGISPGNRWCTYRFQTPLVASLVAGARAAGWQLVVGLNLATNDPAGAARYLQRAIHPLAGEDILAGLEIGNEPDLYPRQGIRPSSYSFTQYLREFNSYARALRRVSSNAPIVGPAWFTTAWDREFGAFLGAAAPLAFATAHYYPFSVCGQGNAARATVPHLLAPPAIAGMLQVVNPLVQVAQQHGLSLRMDEMNSVSCHGKRGVSNTFAAALWALHSMFALAQAGVSGVNFHVYAPFGWPGFYDPVVSHRRYVNGHVTYVVSVRPMYYGLLLFRYAAGFPLLPVTLHTQANIAAYAVRAGSTIRLFLLNMSGRRGTVAIGTPGSAGDAHVLTVLAPSLAATSGVTLGGVAVQNTTGLLPPPHETKTSLHTGSYTVTLPAAGALLLTISTRQ